MSFEELVSYIVKKQDSNFLVPLSEKYDPKTWNAAMLKAMERIGLVNNTNRRRR